MLLKFILELPFGFVFILTNANFLKTRNLQIVFRSFVIIYCYSSIHNSFLKSTLEVHNLTFQKNMFIFSNFINAVEYNFHFFFFKHKEFQCSYTMI